MKMQTGMKLMKDVKPVDGQAIDFVTDDEGRLAFSVKIGEDGRSLEIRACDSFKVDDVLYDNQIIIEPQVSNSIVIRTRRYGH